MSISIEELEKNMIYVQATNGNFDRFDKLTSSQEDVKKYLHLAISHGYLYGLDNNIWNAIDVLDLHIHDRPNLEDLNRIKDEIVEASKLGLIEKSLSDLVIDYLYCMFTVTYDHKDPQTCSKFYKDVQEVGQQVFDSLGECSERDSLKSFMRFGFNKSREELMRSLGLG